MELLQTRIERFLRTSEGDFDALSLELFRYQFEFNRPYRAYCEAQDLTLESVSRWQDIPAVPIGAFKSAELVTFPVGRAAATFESSATTTGVPSRHYLKDMRYYETALKTSFEKWVLPSQNVGVKYSFLILTPAPAESPRSSLSWMMDVVKRTWGGPDSTYFVHRGRLDEPRLVRYLRKAEESKQPVVLLGTTIAFLGFYEYCRTKALTFDLRADSRLMDTGGMKTQKREVSRSDFLRQTTEILGIPENECVNEYGMCELGSQFYGRGVSSYLEGPPWTRTLVMEGHLRHFDLANVDSVLAIQTEDLGIMQGQGFVFQGRDPEATVKGCSLSAEAFLR